MKKLDDVVVYDALEVLRDIRDLVQLTEIETKQGTQGNRGTKKKKPDYKKLITAFDIETSRIEIGEEVHAIMYLWQWSFGNKIVVVGRTWEEFKIVCREVKKALNDNEYLIVYVHNLAHEFQFLTGVLKLDNVFATRPRKVLRAEAIGCLEFRCSYMLTNKSLDMFTKDMNVKHQKLTGTVDYNKVIYPWDDLDDTTLKYSVWDVVGLVEAIEKQLLLDGDSLYTIPMTSTGYVRRDCKAAMRKSAHYRLVETLPTYEVYEFARKAFRGGDTHANRFFVGEIIKNGLSRDGQSAYPHKDCTAYMPTGVWFEYPYPTPENICALAKAGKKAMLMHVEMRDVRLLNPFYPDPYIPISKCEHLSSYISDNGRVLSADYLDIYITDIDLKIILDIYKFSDMNVLRCFTCAYGYLPHELTDVIIDYYKKKTTLKGIVGSEYKYMKSKNKLNATFGMMVQDMIQEHLVYDQDNRTWTLDDTNREVLFNRAKRKAWLSYCWGVWTTARQRLFLHEGIMSTYNPNRGMWDAFYWDTDSVKFIDPDGIHEKWFEDKNQEVIVRSKEAGAYAIDSKGREQIMGVWDIDGRYKFFATLGAKKYAYIAEGEDSLHITIAGVNKEAGAKELAEAGGLEKFIDLENPMVFIEGGGLDAVYNDLQEPIEITISGHLLKVVSNVALLPGTYTLGITSEYHRLLDSILEMEV